MAKRKHEVVDVLQRMKKLIMKEGWIEGSEKVTKASYIKDLMDTGYTRNEALQALKAHPHDVGYCLIGSLKEVTKSRHKRQCAAAALDSMAYGRGDVNMIRFNDRGDNNKDTILEFIDDVIQASKQNGF